MAKSKIQSIVDYVFSYPGISNFVRFILEAGFAETKKTIKKELDCNKKTLDIGCGTGTFSVLFKNYIGIDISPRFIQYARKKYGREFYVGDALKLEFPDNSFDNILVVGVLHHLDDVKFLQVISEIKRVLKKNGRVLVMEDIPASFINIIGKLVHKFDLGDNIRDIEGYRKLLEEKLYLGKSYKIRNGIADYGIFILFKDKSI